MDNVCDCCGKIRHPRYLEKFEDGIVCELCKFDVEGKRIRMYELKARVEASVIRKTIERAVKERR